MSVTFSYPAFASTQLSTITIRSPELMDGEASTYELQTMLSRSGTFRTVVSHDKEKNVYTTSLDFVNLCQTDKDALETFVLAAQGHYVLYTDYNSVEWYCVITDESVNFTTESRGLSFSTSLTLNRWLKV